MNEDNELNLGIGNISEISDLTKEIATALMEVKLIQEGKMEALSFRDLT